MAFICFGFRVSGSGCRVQGVGCRVQGSGFRVEGAGFRVQGSGFRVPGSGFRVQGSGCRVQGAGFRVQGSGFRVQGSGSRVQVSGFRVQSSGSKVVRNERRCFIGGDGGQILTIINIDSQIPPPAPLNAAALPPWAPHPSGGASRGVGSPSFPARSPALISKRARRGVGRGVRLAPSPAHHARI